MIKKNGHPSRNNSLYPPSPPSHILRGDSFAICYPVWEVTQHHFYRPWLKQLQAQPHSWRKDKDTLKENMWKEEYCGGHLWRMKSAKHPSTTTSDWRVGIVSKGKRVNTLSKGEEQRERVFCPLLIQLCHNHPCREMSSFTKEQGDTSRCSGSRGYCQPIYARVRTTEKTGQPGGPSQPTGM